ncbi:MAG: hypothetical protein AB8B53_02900 [Flavobacteriales bacterium]
MTSKTLSTELNIVEVKERGIGSGYLKIKSSVSLLIDKIDGYIFIEARGRMRGQKERILVFPIKRILLLPENEWVKIPISFGLPRNKIVTYQGVNVNFTYKCEVVINVNESDLEKLDRNLIKKLTSFVTSDYSYEASTYFIVSSDSGIYEVQDRNVLLEPQLNIKLSIIGGLIFLGVYALFVPGISIPLMCLGIILALVFVFAINSFIANLIGSVFVKTFKGNELITCDVSLSKNFALSNLKLQYVIIEKVVDSRGTSSITQEARIYSSELKSVDLRKKRNQIAFDFPKRKGIGTYSYHEASIVWQLKLKGELFGLSYILTGSFTVWEF